MQQLEQCWGLEVDCCAITLPSHTLQWHAVSEHRYKLLGPVFKSAHLRWRADVVYWILSAAQVPQAGS